MDKSKQAIQVFDTLAEQYQQKFMDVSIYHDMLDLFCRNVPKQANVLDIACGPGNISKYLLSKRPDFNLLGIDLAPNMLSLAKANNPSADFQLMDCRNISDLDKTFEGIICGFALPYLSKDETVKLIADCSLLLTDSGVMYISTMEGAYESSEYERSSSGHTMFIHYHEAEYILNAIYEHKMRIIDIQRKQYASKENKTVIDLVIVCKRENVS